MIRKEKKGKAPCQRRSGKNFSSDGLTECKFRGGLSYHFRERKQKTPTKKGKGELFYWGRA